MVATRITLPASDNTVVINGFRVEKYHACSWNKNKGHWEFVSGWDTLGQAEKALARLNKKLGKK